MYALLLDTVPPGHDPVKQVLESEFKYEVFHCTPQSFHTLDSISPELIVLRESVSGEQLPGLLSGLRQKYPVSKVVIFTADINADTIAGLYPLQADTVFTASEKSPEDLRIWMKYHLPTEGAPWLFHPYIHAIRHEIPDYYFTFRDEPVLKLQQEMIKSGNEAWLCLKGSRGMGYSHICCRLEKTGKPILRLDISADMQADFHLCLFGSPAESGALGMASGGLLVLDDMAELSLRNQGILLSLLRSRMYSREGESKRHMLECRLVAYTRHSLWELVEEGRFNEELYFLLSGRTIRLPDMNDRHAALGEMAHYTLAHIALAEGLPPLGLDNDALGILRRMKFPGNYAEFYNLLRGLVRSAENHIISGRHMLAAVEPGRQQDTILAGEIIPLDELTAAHINRTLKYFGGNVAAAADALKISKSTIYAMIRNRRL